MLVSAVFGLSFPRPTLLKFDEVTELTLSISINKPVGQLLEISDDAGQYRAHKSPNNNEQL